MSKVRIQKALSAAGVASRRSVEQMILDGRVAVNGRIVTDLPYFVEPSDDIRVDGRRVKRAPRETVAVLLNKPKGVVCTQRDPSARPRAVDLIGETGVRLYCAGRLDADSTGLVVLTNDGELTNIVTHPRYGVHKTYVVEVAGRVDGRAVEKLKSGMWLEGAKRGARVSLLRRGPASSLLKIRIAEGRNRQVRRVLARLGHNVRKLRRTAIGPITDRGLKIGSWRRLSAAEVAKLRSAGCRERGRRVSGRKRKQ